MLKVVVVEDEEFVRRGIVLTVDWASVDCVVVGEAADGLAGLETIRRCKPDLVVTDIKMPRLDGVEMLGRLREEGNGVYAIFLTAYSDFSYAQAAVKLGAADYLLKPFHDGELEAAVGRVRDRIRAQAERGARAVAGPIDGRGKSKYVQETLSYIAEHYNDPEISVASIARFLEVSESHLSHVFRKETSYTIAGCITDCRVRAAMEQLKDCRAKVYEVAERVGYRDVTYFSATFKKVVGLSPSDYQKSCQ